MKKIIKKIKDIKLSKKQKYIFIIACSAFCLIAASIYTVFIQPALQAEKWVYMESEVIAGDMTIGVTESGSLEYGETSQDYDIDLDFSEDADEESEEDEEDIVEKYLKVEDVYIVVGQRISEGQAAIKFTDDSIEDVRKLLTSNLTEAKIAYSEAKTEYDVNVLSSDEDYQSSMVSGVYASKIYSQSILKAEGDITNNLLEIEQLSADIETLNESIDDLYEVFCETKETYDSAYEYVSGTDFSNIAIYVEAQTIYMNAESSYKKAEEEYNNAIDQIASKTEEIEELNTEISALKAELSLEKIDLEHEYAMSIAEQSVAESQYNISVSGLKENLTEAESDVEAAEEELEVFEEFVGDGTIYTSGAGIVTSVSYEIDDYLIEKGSVFSYAEEDEMTISVDVSQEDVIDLSINDDVQISFLAYDGEIYQGIISEITTTVTSEDSATVSYPVLIRVLGDTSKLYGGMTADITFVTETKTDTLYVSKKAIVEQNGSYFVYVDAFGGYELQEVKIGITDGIYTEIVDGLSAGDQIYIATKVTSNATKTEVTEEENNNEDEADVENSGDIQDMEMLEGMPSGEMPSGGMPSGERPEGMEDMP